MKRKLLLSLGCAVICAASSVGLNASAASQTNEGLTAEIIADSNYYDSDETAEILLKVTNHNDFAVSNVSIESVLPDGLKLVDTEESSGDVDSLAAGETLKLSVKVAKDAAPGNGDQPSSTSTTTTTQAADSTTTQTDSASTTTSTSDSSTTTTTTAKATVTTKGASSPNTGENSAIKIVIFLAIAALLVFVFTSKKRTARMLSLLLTVSICGSSIGNLRTDAADDSSFTLSEELNFGGDKYTFTMNTSYDKIQYDMSVTYTRGEWMLYVADLVGINDELIDIDPETYDYFYGDTLGAENGMIFEYLYKYGAVPAPDNEGYVDPEQDIPLFEADKPVTREYAAYSAVKLLGFQDSPDAPQCADAASLKYPAAVSTALKFDMLKTNNGYFEPNKLLTQNDYCQITAVIKAFERSLYITEEESAHNVTYVEGVIADEIADLTGFTVTDNGNNSYTAVLPANAVTSTFTEGTVFVLPANDKYENGISLKVTSVEKNGSAVTAQCVMPEIQEVLRSIYLMDTVQPDPADFVPAEGVIASLGDSAEASGDAAPVDIELFDIDEQFEPSVPLAFSGKFFDDCLEVEGSFSVPLISIVYKTHEEIGWDFWNADYVTDEAMFCINARLDTNVSLILAEASDFNGGDDVEAFLGSVGAIGGSEGTILAALNHKQDDLRLGSIPVPIGGGFHADLEVFLSFDGSGKFTVGFAFDATVGSQYINGESRNLNQFKPSLSKIELAAEVKFGPKLMVSLGWTAIDRLIGVDAFGGVCISGALTLHPDAKLFCVDGSLYAFLELGLSEETKLGGFLKKHGWEARADVINSDNSPLKLNAHFENFKKVPDCTYGSGKLSIHVTDADNNPIKQSMIKVYDNSGNHLKTVYTNSSGNVTISDLKIGSVKLEIKATGYKIFTDRQFIRSNQTTYCEAVLMVSRTDENASTESGTGTNFVKGTLKDAVTGNLTDGTFKVRKGYNASDDKEVIADGATENGSYKISLPVGYYTFTFSKEGYLDSKVNVVVKASSPTTKNVVISTELQSVDTDAEMRIVLTWGLEPEDLDSHLLSSDSESYHIYFKNMNVYRGDEKAANLDVDDISSYGPETTTIYEFKADEKLSYYVHDYTNKALSENYMSYSGAHVVVYSGNNVVAVFDTPIGVNGNLWHVFDYDPATGEITPVNTYSTLDEYGYRSHFMDEH